MSAESDVISMKGDKGPGGMPREFSRRKSGAPPTVQEQVRETWAKIGRTPSPPMEEVMAKCEWNRLKDGTGFTDCGNRWWKIGEPTKFCPSCGKETAVKKEAPAPPDPKP